MSPLSELILPRLPYRPLCTDNLEHGLVRRSGMQAIEKPHLQLNPPVLWHWLLFDIDREGAAYAWESANLPPPNWAAINPENGHAHLAYLLSAPVLTTVDGLKRPLLFAAAVQAAMHFVLRADPGYTSTITKNPLHERWRTLRFHDNGYGLNDLAEYVELPKRTQPRAEQPRVGLFRNVTLFDELRTWAYDWVLKFKQADATLEYWIRALMTQAELINHNFTVPLSGAEVKAIVRSVAKWVWRTFTEDDFREIQRARGRRSGEKRRQGSLAEQRPWEAMEISRRTYFSRKKAGMLAEEVALEPCQIPTGWETEALEDGEARRVFNREECKPEARGVAPH